MQDKIITFSTFIHRKDPVLLIKVRLLKANGTLRQQYYLLKQIKNKQTLYVHHNTVDFIEYQMRPNKT